MYKFKKITINKLYKQLKVTIMKTKSIIFFFFLIAFANLYGATRYWVGTTAGTWATAANWGTSSGSTSTPGVPAAGDDVIFDNSAGNANPTVTLGAAVTVNSITFTSSNVTFAGLFAITANSMTVTSSQVTFIHNVTLNSALTFSGTTPRITHAGSGSILTFKLGNGGAFTLTGNSATNYFTGGGNTNFRYDTTTPLTVYFKANNPTLGNFMVDRGLITLGNSIATSRLGLGATNSQELILGTNVTFTLAGSASSVFTNLANGGVVNAAASGSKFLMTSTGATVLSTSGRIFKANTTINNFEFNSTGTFNLAFPMTVRTLTLTAGTINNSTNSITIAAGGSVVTGAGTTTAAVINGTPTTRYWVGGSTGNWLVEANWGTSSGNTSTPGIPEYGDNVIFDNSTGNENPTVTLTDNVTSDSLLFNTSNVTFAGNYAITATSMTVESSQVVFVDNVTLNSALTFSGTNPRVSQNSAIGGRYLKLGNGGAFTLTGNSSTNYFSGVGFTSFIYDTTTPLTVYFKPSLSVGYFQVDKGLITLGNSLITNRLNFRTDKLNNQELILGENVTFTLNAAAASSVFTNLANGGVVNASASGSKFVISATSSTILSTTGRIFKENTTINNFEFNSTEQTFNLPFPMTVDTLTLTAGTINNSTNNITIAAGGNIVTNAGSTTVPVIAGLPGAPTSVDATAGNGQASVSFITPAGDGGSAILDYTITSSPDNIVATGTESPLLITGLTNGVAYTFTVTARNSVGSGILSSPSVAVTPSITSIKDVVSVDKPFKYSVSEGVLKVSEVVGSKQISIYTLTGNLYKQLSITGTFSILLEKGAYVVKLENYTPQKVVIY